jgi:hypothetical protein
MLVYNIFCFKKPIYMHPSMLVRKSLVRVLKQGVLTLKFQSLVLSYVLLVRGITVCNILEKDQVRIMFPYYFICPLFIDETLDYKTRRI